MSNEQLPAQTTDAGVPEFAQAFFGEAVPTHLVRAAGGALLVGWMRL
jgi:hypothetical protein